GWNRSGIGKGGEGAEDHGGRTGARGNSEGAGESEGQAPALHRRGGRAGGDQRLVLVFPQPGNNGRRASGRAHHADGVEGLRARGGSFGGRQPASESRASAGENRSARLPGGGGSGQGCTGAGGKRSAFGRRGRAADAGERSERNFERGCAVDGRAGGFGEGASNLRPGANGGPRVGAGERGKEPGQCGIGEGGPGAVHPPDGEGRDFEAAV